MIVGAAIGNRRHATPVAIQHGQKIFGWALIKRCHALSLPQNTDVWTFAPPPELCGAAACTAATLANAVMCS